MRRARVRRSRYWNLLLDAWSVTVWDVAPGGKNFVRWAQYPTYEEAWTDALAAVGLAPEEES